MEKEISIDRLIKSGLTKANSIVLIKIIREFGSIIRYMSYRDLGHEIGMSYENVRHHFKALENNGYMIIEKNSAHKFVFYINVEKVNKLYK